MDRWIARFKSCLYSHVGVEDIKISLFFTWFFALFADTIVNKCDIHMHLVIRVILRSTKGANLTLKLTD